MRLLDMQPRDLRILRACLLSGACITIGLLVWLLASGLAAKLGLLFALAGLACLLVNLGD